MKYALNIGDNGRILSATFAKYAANGQVFVDTIPDGDISDYLYVDGQYVYDPLPEPEEIDLATADDVLNALLGVTE